MSSLNSLIPYDFLGCFQLQFQNWWLSFHKKQYYNHLFLFNFPVLKSSTALGYLFQCLVTVIQNSNIIFSLIYPALLSIFNFLLFDEHLHYQVFNLHRSLIMRKIIFCLALTGLRQLWFLHFSLLVAIPIFQLYSLYPFKRKLDNITWSDCWTAVKLREISDSVTPLHKPINSL